MSLRTTAARTIGGAMTAIRIPADTTLRLIGRAPLGGALQGAVEGADANVRKLAGRILGTDEVPVVRPKSQPKREEKPRRQRKSRPSNDVKTSARKSPVGQSKPRKAAAKEVRQAGPGEAVSGFPEPPGKDPGDISRDPEPHHALSHPVNEPDPTEWPDPYDDREDPRDPPDPDDRPFGEEPHVATGSMSTSEPHPGEDPEAGERQNAPERDRLDD
jgi:hypothetical protein